MNPHMMLKQEMNMVPYIAVSINHLCALVRESLDRRPKKIDTTHVVSVVQQDFLNLDLFTDSICQLCYSYL